MEPSAWGFRHGGHAALGTSRTPNSIPRPLGPDSALQPSASCGFEKHITSALQPSGNTITFVDDYEACHLHTGEIHCTTFEVRRAPERPDEVPRPAPRGPRAQSDTWARSNSDSAGTAFAPWLSSTRSAPVT
ncbi:protein-arginine deiminase family protein [Myxococcus landrumensis]|uniref:Protein-arginine deiminase C-terminal domain-containing protein n=1 Tax=Myxococcus landrumensis TaxID=2813577 RepID=A0ABX7N8H9_9BACT|nr:hypothetical protein JY572_36255 [Myxococcus landrumus]